MKLFFKQHVKILKVKFKNVYQKTSSNLNVNKPKRTQHNVYVVNKCKQI